MTSQIENQTNPNLEQSVEYEVLLSRCSPNNFMDPYDAEKVALANKIYSSILANRNDIEKLKKLKKEAEKKLNIILSD